MFWVRLDQQDLVGSKAEAVSVGDNIVGRTNVDGGLIGGRVYQSNRDTLFLGALEGRNYKLEPGEFEVHQAVYHQFSQLLKVCVSDI